jgi:hydrocephalus-inducing protein
LAPGQKVEVVVEFDPVYRDDRMSHVVDKQLTIIYRGHPQKDSIPLRAEVIFPNLVFDHSVINFGCVLNDTSKTLKVKATNSCKIDVNYEWIFVESSAPKHKARGSVLSMPPSQVFDILPVKSLLHPGTSEDVEFSLYGNANTKFSGVVLCVVEGGPEYKFPITGEASTVSYSLTRSVIDFGKVIFTEKGDEELEIVNHGKVPFNFSVAPASPSGAQILELIPSTGKVPANGSTKVIVRIRPGLPVPVHEQLVVQVAHFDAVYVSCYCQGTFPTAVITLPHYRKLGPYGETENVDAAMWDAFHAKALANINAPDPSLLPPALPFPVPASGSTAQPPVYEPSFQPPAPPDVSAAADDSTEAGSLAGGKSHASLTSQAKGVQHAILEVEMQRMVLAHHLAEKVRELELDRKSTRLNSSHQI